MDTIYIEKIYHNAEMTGIGSIFRTKEQAVDFLRRVKKELTEQGGCKIIHYCEKELRIIYKDALYRTTYAFEQRCVA